LACGDPLMRVSSSKPTVRSLGSTFSTKAKNALRAASSSVRHVIAM
jgi:hypothetical protein